MKRLLFISLILIVGLAVFAQTQNTYKADVSVYFSPDNGCQKAIIEEIKDADKSIHVAMYYFTNKKLADALIKAKGKGVTIKVLLDNGQRTARDAKANLLTDNNIPVLYYGSSSRDMHHKFAVLDKKRVITGSFNWTGKAETNNNENLLIIRSPDIAKRYLEVWESLWEKGK